MNPVSDEESSSISSISETDSIKDYSDNENEVEDKDSPILHDVPASLPENKEATLEEVSRLWSHATQYRILCKIRCGSADVLRHHFAEYYEDVPFKSRDSGITSRHLSGHIPIPSLKRYISAIKKKASFLVCREYYCTNTRRYAPRHRKTIFPKLAMSSRDREVCDESIVVISRSLDSAIRQISICHYPDTFNHLAEELANFGYLRLKPPYAFVYHHRSLLLEHAKNCTPSVRSQILAFLDYVEGNFGARFKQADELFRDGKTDQHTLEYLFCPGDIVLSYKQETYAAYNLTSWPHRYVDLDLKCWGWTFDGLQFLRKGVTLSIRPDQIRTTVPIQGLPVYPIKYAPQDLRNDLKRRGERFWNLRFQHYISYTGWDVTKTENHVRYFRTLQVD